MKKILVVTFMMMLTSYAQAFDVISGCEEEDYVDAGSEAAVATQGLTYTPKCLRVVVGSDVTIAASGHHPLAPLAENQDDNPIPVANETVTVTFDEVGTYGYFCSNHGGDDGTGMAGSILVVEE